MARSSYAKIVFDDWTKGVYFGAQSEQPYLVDSLNMTIEQDGMIRSRWGTGTAFGSGYSSGTYIFVSGKTVWSGGTAASPYAFVQDGTSIKRVQLTGGGTATLTPSLSTSAKVQMVDFGDKIYLVHPVDGVMHIDNPTDTSFTVDTTAVKGNCIGVWQNKLWVGGDPSNPERIWWSNPGPSEGTFTTATDWVDIREASTRPNQAPGVRAVGVGNGMDVVGRGGLYVFMDQSIHRIYDSTTGAYTTEAVGPGASSNEAVTSGPDGLFCANNWGIYRFGGGEKDAWEPIHFPINALWDRASPVDNIVAWSCWGRHYFARGTANAFEYVPWADAWFRQQYGSSGTTYPVVSASSQNASGLWVNQGATLLLGTAGITVHAPTHTQGSSTSQYDNGTMTPTTILMTPWLTTEMASKFRVRRLTAHGFYDDTGGPATQSMYLHRDWQTYTNRTSRTLYWHTSASPATNTNWGLANSLGAQRALSIELTTGDAALQGIEIVNGTTNNWPLWGLRKMVLDVVPLRY